MMTPSPLNFYAGPAILPREVLTATETALRDFGGTGIGIMEISHRSEAFAALVLQCKERLRSLLSLSSEYEVLFTTGGATQQFSMVPQNLLASGKKGAYLLSGIWSKKALAEAKKFGHAYCCGSTEDISFKSLPAVSYVEDDTSFIHFTSNNTIIGSQFDEEPFSDAHIALVADSSSDFLCRSIDINKYGLVYASAQKNLGPSGVTLVVIRKELVEPSNELLALTSSYHTYLRAGSLYNTPPTLPIFVVNEVLSWITERGGLETIGAQNRKKAALIYDIVDAYEMYEPVVKVSDRSLMNITFRLCSPDLEARFLNSAEEEGFRGLRGHRLVGGVRASLYNAQPLDSCVELARFMRHFAESN